MVLVHLLQALVRTGSITASIVHVDHAVRPDSPYAASLVEEYAGSAGMTVRIVRLAEGVVSRHPGVGTEEALRRERYDAFATVLRDIGATAVVLAHHQRDQAETVLLHLIRGAGLHGAAGMREWSSIDVPWWQDRSQRHAVPIWRPLLMESPAQIDAWRRQHALPVFEDTTNQHRHLRRNAVRHDVLPILEHIFSGATTNLARFAELAAEDDDVLDTIANQHIILIPDGRLHRRAVIDAPRAIQRRMLRNWILGQGYDGDLTSNRIDAVRALASRNRSRAHVELGGGWSIHIDGDELILQAV